MTVALVLAPAAGNTQSRTSHLEGRLLSTLRLGTGYDPVRSALRGSCVALTETTQTASSAETWLTFVQSHESLESALGLDAAARVRTPTWSADASASFLRSDAVEADAVYIVVDRIVRLRTRTGTGDLTPVARNLLANPAAFVQQCGDEYVRSITEGGRYRAILRYQGLSHRASQRLRASLSGGTATAAGRVAATSTSTRSLQQYAYTLYLLQAGSIQPATIDAAQLLANALAFQPATTDAVPIEAETDSYLSLPGAAGQSLPSVSSRREYLEGLARQYRMAQTRRTSVRRLLARAGARLASASCQPTRESLDNAEEEYTSVLARIARLADRCADTGQCDGERVSVPSSPAVPPECRPPCGERGAPADAYGHCTSCVWTVSRALIDTGGGRGMAAECSGMYLGAEVTVRYAGSTTVAGSSTGRAELTLQVDQEGSYTTRSVRDDVRPGGGVSFDLQATATVGDDGRVSARLVGENCSAFGGSSVQSQCVVGGTISICDTAVGCPP